MTKLEKAEEEKVLKWCKLNDVLFIKFTPFGQRGWPDRIAVLPQGQHIWVEMKRKGEKPRPLQVHRMGQLHKQGAIAMWFDSATDCINYLKEMNDGMDPAPVPA